MHLTKDEDEDDGRRLRREGIGADRWCLGSGDVLVGRQHGASSPGPHHVTRSQSWVDRISALPDDLLLQVLTRLHCARTAARTSLLGHRWRWVWRDLPEVSFRGLTPEAIHVVLTRFTCTSLEAIDIHVSKGTGHRALDAGSITSLLHAAAGRLPMKLSLTIPDPVFLYYFTVDLPRFDFTTSIKLDVRGVCFALPAATEFPKLETLSLSGCIVDLATLVSRCPRLRVLSVTNTPHMVEAITVHSASLEELIVSTFLFTSSIDIVAPVLRKLTLSVAYRDIEYNLSVVAPMVEEVAWHHWRCVYYNMHVRIGNMWSVKSLKVRGMEKVELTDDDNEGIHQPHRAHVLSVDIFDTPYPAHRDLAEELKEIPVATFSVLELKISTWSHVLGPVLLDLLQICTAVQRLDVVLVDTGRELVTNNSVAWCKEWCPRKENNRKWRTETTISLIDLTEVEIKGLKGDEEEIHFLKLLFRCAPMLQTMTLALSDEVTNDWYNIFLNTVQDYPYVNSSVCISVDQHLACFKQ